MKDKEGKLSVEMKNKPRNEILHTNVQGKKIADEIDEIFAIKKKRKWKRQKKKRVWNLQMRGKKMKRNKVSGGVAYVDPPSRPKREANDGFTIYSETELGIANSDAGGTRLCPFDCSCCF
ncbi:hypothetical protein MKW92_044901 [Papaver armeniacum]|nr:hypothetical protein MKW92_044901 [Papaver armeniacum]